MPIAPCLWYNLIESILLFTCVWRDLSLSRYQRWWNEEHFGNGHVRKYGNSTGGEYWDNTEQMDTYYNPIPHFGSVMR
jgi:hypothetical protein